MWEDAVRHASAELSRRTIVDNYYKRYVKFMLKNDCSGKRHLTKFFHELLWTPWPHPMSNDVKSQLPLWKSTIRARASWRTLGGARGLPYEKNTVPHGILEKYCPPVSALHLYFLKNFEPPFKKFKFFQKKIIIFRFSQFWKMRLSPIQDYYM